MFLSESSSWPPIDQLQPNQRTTPALHRRRTTPATSPSTSPIRSSATKSNASSAKWTFIPTTRTSDCCPSSKAHTPAGSTGDTSPDCARNSRRAWSARSTGASVPDTCRRTTNRSSFCRIRDCSIRNDRCVPIITRPYEIFRERESRNMFEQSLIWK